jgi:hypothetical protein
MKRGGPLRRKTPLHGSTPLQRAARLAHRPMERKRRAQSAEERSGRAAVGSRSGGRCEIDPLDAATDWSHRVARSRGGSWRPANGIDTCRRHHREAHDQPERARALGWHVRTGQDPATVPVRLAVGWALLGDDGSVTPVVVEDAA